MQFSEISLGAATSFPERTIPCRSGIGARYPHYARLRQEKLPDIHWCEVHSENFFATGGITRKVLEEIRQHYPLSLHGVGLSLGSASPLSTDHLSQLKQLVDWSEPGLISEHVSWSMVDGIYANDLLPLPYTEAALAVLVAHVQQVQELLRRPILIENPSTYLAFTSSTMPEWEFITAVANQTGCGILLDINNIYVSSHNHGYSPLDYLRNIPPALVQEIHLAGHSAHYVESSPLLIDDHGSQVAPTVWELYTQAIALFGLKPTLIEWDTQIPTLEILTAEAAKADKILENYSHANTENAPRHTTSVCREYV